MDSDDILKGRILSRREVLGLFGAAGAAFLVACSGDDEPSIGGSGSGIAPAGTTAVAGGSASVSAAATATSVPSCVVLPDLTEGPYFVDTQLDRSDIRSDPTTGAVSEGAELTLTLNVLSVGWRFVCPDGRCNGRHLAVRCARRLLRSAGQRSGLQHSEPEVPARFPDVRHQRPGEVHDRLPRLVPWPLLSDIWKPRRNFWFTVLKSWGCPNPRSRRRGRRTARCRPSPRSSASKTRRRPREPLESGSARRPL